MRSQLLIVLFIILFATASKAQTHSKFIIVDQIGYLPQAKKIAVIKNPQTGFDAGESFVPGDYYSVVNATTGEKVYRGEISRWKNGSTDASSGDKAWHFDFSGVEEPGRYFVLDEQHDLRSYEFEIAHNVYNELLRQAMRSFFYQRSGFNKEVAYAGEAWADSASHIGPLQDANCRSFFDQDNPATEKDLSGGWYDAGDYNKYTNWTANYVVEMMKAYLEKPQAWADDYNIPESGNGIPDILDEAVWGIDHLMRMQQQDGSVLSIVGESHGSPPSAVTGPSYYGPANTSATMNTAAAFVIASKVYRSAGMTDYADTLLARALRAWEWGDANPLVLFYNNSADYDSEGLGAGQQEVGDYDRDMIKLEAACFLFEVTGDVSYRDYFDANYQDCHLIASPYAYPFETTNQDVLLYYTTLDDGTVTVQEDILSVYKNAVINGGDNLAAYLSNKDPYLAYIKDYTWGSNNTKSSQGNMYYDLISYKVDSAISSTAWDAALTFINYINGVNPLNFVYLSNMYAYGAENGVNEFYHSWFSDGSALWDRVGVSVYGPAPGFLAGGPNPGYDWDDCCPTGCWSAENNAKCLSESITPPKGQPDQKSYKDFNTSWPLNSWSVTENSCGYQVSYIRLLSKYVTAGRDCNGDDSGSAFIDSCGVCAGGNTGITPSLDPGACIAFPDTTAGDTMYVEGRYLYTARGERVILKGVNEMFVWSDDKSGIQYLPQIDQTGANCVRLVWTEEEGNKETLVELIDNCIAGKMIAMPECHSATGDWENLDVCVDFWRDTVLMEGIQRNRRWTLLNIGNEVGDGNVSDQQFRDEYMAAIDSLREYGYTVPIVIDASTWGQNVDIIFNNWKEILAHDPLENVLFSVHSYWSTTDNYHRVATRSINEGLPVIIGEGPSPTAYPTCNILDFGTGLDATGRNDIGWLSWSWGGVSNGHCVPNFDHTIDGIFAEWETPYAASMMADHPYSLMRTASRPSSFYEDDTVRVSGIYLSPDINTMIIGDTIPLEVIIAPVNAINSEYLIEIQGDTEAVTYDSLTGMLVARAEGTVTLKALSLDKNSITFSREIEVRKIAVTGITISPAVEEMYIHDSLFIEAEIQPQDASVQDFHIRVAEGNSLVDFDQSTGRLIAMDTGLVTIEVVSHDTDSFTLSMDIRIIEKAVTSIVIIPSLVDMFVNDTVYLEVEVQPEDATVKEYSFEIIQGASIIDFDETTGMLVAIGQGTAAIEAVWAKGDISGTVFIRISVVVGNEVLSELSSLRMYPNPGRETLIIECGKQFDYELIIININGKTVIHDNYSGNSVIDIHELQSGYYEVLIRTDKGVKKSKLIKL